MAQAERVAKVPKLKGSLWHAYRRKWPSERKHMPLTDVAAVGGWKDVETLLKCYSQADRNTVLSVMRSRTSCVTPMSPDTIARGVPDKNGRSRKSGPKLDPHRLNSRTARHRIR